MVFLLNVACRDIDQELLKKLSTSTGNKHRFTCPVGWAWFAVFQYIYNNRGLIPWTAQNMGIVVNTLKTWTVKYETGETTRLAGRIALYLKSEIWKREWYPYTLRRDSRFITLTDVISAAAMELKQELTDIFQFLTDIQLDDATRRTIYSCKRACPMFMNAEEFARQFRSRYSVLRSVIGATLLNENIMTILITAWSTISVRPTAWI